MVNILVVDDDADILEIYQLYLSATYNLTTKTRPREALEFVRSGTSIDLIISDFNMPQMNGVELLQAVHQAEVQTGQSHTKKILATSHEEVHIRRELEQLRRGGTEVHYFDKGSMGKGGDKLLELIKSLTGQ